MLFIAEWCFGQGGAVFFESLPPVAQDVTSSWPLQEVPDIVRDAFAARGDDFYFENVYFNQGVSPYVLNILLELPMFKNELKLRSFTSESSALDAALVKLSVRSSESLEIVFEAKAAPSETGHPEDARRTKVRSFHGDDPLTSNATLLHCNSLHR